MNLHDGNVFEMMRILLSKHRVAAAAYRTKREQVPEPEINEQMLERLEWERSAGAVTFSEATPSKKTEG
ncbi:MAG: hypothetical protein OWQ59_02650 [Alicyclobacillaceae bacterium]|nr:hypothetical protein [Alicyclobacillaceae bacterium]